jgi:hypothetical protein
MASSIAISRLINDVPRNYHRHGRGRKYRETPIDLHPTRTQHQPQSDLHASFSRKSNRLFLTKQTAMPCVIPNVTILSEASNESIQERDGRVHKNSCKHGLPILSRDLELQALALHGRTETQGGRGQDGTAKLETLTSHRLR